MRAQSVSVRITFVAQGFLHTCSSLLSQGENLAVHELCSTCDEDPSVCVWELFLIVYVGCFI